MPLNICPACKKKYPVRYLHCVKTQTMCPAMEILGDGDNPLKERLLNINFDQYPNQDYKASLIEAQQSKQNNHRKRFRSPEEFEQFRDDPRVHIIVLALNARIKIKQIAWAMNLNERTVRRLRKKGE